LGEEDRLNARRSLQDIADPKVRGLLRGLLDRKAGPRELRSTLNRLLASVSVDDLGIVDEIVRGDRLFSHVELTPEFPEAPPFKGGAGVTLVPEGAMASEYMRLRIAENASRLAEGLRLLADLNNAILEGDDSAILRVLAQTLNAMGHSLTLARKAAVVVGYSPKDMPSYRACVELVSGYGVNGRNYGMMATIDSIAVEFNYLDLKYRFRDFASADGGAGLVQRISHLCFSPLAASSADAAAVFAASYEISLLDATVALLAHREEGLVQVELPIDVELAWADLSRMPTAAFTYFPADDEYADLYAFRSAPAFLEYERFRRLRITLQPLYDLPELRTSATTSAASADFFREAGKISDLIPAEDTVPEPLPERFDRQTAGTLVRSCAVVWACERDPNFSSIGKEAMASLMGHTFELDRLLATDVLRSAATSATDEFVQLVLQTLLRAHSSATRDSYNFKERFQRYVRERHRGDILGFMAEVHSLSPNIVHYFVMLLDETMLSQMAFLMESSDSIYQTRASLLEWFADLADDEMSRDKAKQLRLDRKIAAVRGAINETRLNIDSSRFRQWIEQNKLTDFSDFIRQAVLDLPSVDDLTDASKAATRFLAAHREPTTRALLSLVECYEGFCRNPDFGIASFLGRRIRHGTLRGTLLNGLPETPSDLPSTAAAQYESWCEGYSSSIDALTSTLYFRDRSVHRDGLLNAEITTAQQWQVCLVCLKAIDEQARQDHGILVVPLLIEQYCWLAFESELASVRDSIGEARTRWAVLKLRHGNGDEAVAAFEKNVNIAVSDRFATVMSWFRKPPNISPVAELAHVVEVVVQEAKAEYASYCPEVELLGERELQLSGTTYYVTYDALTIAVRNAAKHGSHPGALSIRATVDDAGSAKVLTIETTSTLKPGDTPAAALDRMFDAGKAGPVNADIVEGVSGMRKLQKMAADRRILRFEADAVPGRPDLVRISIVLPFKGIVE
jgi:hypothetical protein